MSGRDLVDEIRSGARPISPKLQRLNVFDFTMFVVTILAVGVLGYVAFRAWSPGQGPTPPVQGVVASLPTSAPTWTDADRRTCDAKARAAARNPNTGSYMITNDTVAEGVAGLATQVECKLVTKSARFCGSAGTAELVAIVNDYINRMDLVRLGLAAQGAPMALAGGLFGGEAAGGHEVYSSMEDDTLAYMKTYDQRIAKVFRSLASRGMVKADDFRQFPLGGVPKPIEALFAGVVVTSNLCS